MAIVEPMDSAIGQREMRHVAEEDGGDAMAFEIERGDGRHGLVYYFLLLANRCE